MKHPMLSGYDPLLRGSHTAQGTPRPHCSRTAPCPPETTRSSTSTHGPAAPCPVDIPVRFSPPSPQQQTVSSCTVCLPACRLHAFPISTGAPCPAGRRFSPEMSSWIPSGIKTHGCGCSPQTRAKQEKGGLSGEQSGTHSRGDGVKRDFANTTGGLATYQSRFTPKPSERPLLTSPPSLRWWRASTRPSGSCPFCEPPREEEAFRGTKGRKKKKKRETIDLLRGQQRQLARTPGPPPSPLPSSAAAGGRAPAWRRCPAPCWRPADARLEAPRPPRHAAPRRCRCPRRRHQPRARPRPPALRREHRPAPPPSRQPRRAESGMRAAACVAVCPGLEGTHEDYIGRKKGPAD